MLVIKALLTVSLIGTDEYLNPTHTVLHCSRSLQWHPTQSEWSFFLSGNARLTSYAASGNARTFDAGPGDILVIPPSFGH